MCPTTPSSGSYQHASSSTSVMRPPTPLPPSAPQTTSSTPQSTDDDKHAFSSICTPTAQFTDQDKEALAMQADDGIFRFGDLSVYAPHGTPVEKLTMEHVVRGGKTSNTVKLSPTQSTTLPLFKRHVFFFSSPHVLTLAVGWCRWSWSGLAVAGEPAALHNTTTCFDVCLVCTWLSGQGTPPIN